MLDKMYAHFRAREGYWFVPKAFGVIAANRTDGGLRWRWGGGKGR